MYTQKVLEHFRTPHNFGSMDNPTAVGQVGNLACGDVMKLYLKIAKNKKGEDYIQDIKFETLGCAAAIATSSVVTDLAKNKTLIEALKIKNEDIIKALDDLPAVKIHCSLLAADALAEAIYEFYQKNHQPISPELEKLHQRITVCQTRLNH
ncbi:MAG: iron-sulfur cluster assembly scaffold protein [Candidatus Shapirobacteria bacterium]|nr:iron-sulfur cluster assembly scaffold protein [Candidatus Shapirobacteria bacterium]MDD3002725.1 iron-sulfur cluster assembly scaffold protein [Candidatus Shapirobacteria bacterium]MDD4382914.1 iron-sulfur cluster assembly scaffold protein [Candidatus Shapirobacteria bacterium]